MSLPVHKQPVHQMVTNQNEWAKATARIRELIDRVPPALVDHFVNELRPPPPPPPEPAAIDEEPPPPDDPPPRRIPPKRS